MINNLILFSLINILLNFYSSSQIVGLIAGEILIIAFIKDIKNDRSIINIYRIILIYFYYYLVIINGYVINENIYYNEALLITIISFISFIYGYNFNKKYNVYEYTTLKCRYINHILIFTLLISTFLQFFSAEDSSNKGYSDQFLKYDDALRINIFDVVYAQFIYFFKDLICIAMGNPIYISAIKFIQSIQSYSTSGIKGTLLSSTFIMILYFQYSKITQYKYSKFFINISIIFFAFILIGSTSFRNTLGLGSLINTITSSDKLFSGFYSFIDSPESKHLEYLADILDKLNSGVIEFRYGFDYYRFLIYPFKEFIKNYEFSSFVQYAIITTGINISQGFYLGLIGELFWNFGYFTIPIAIIIGYLLKLYTNYCYSGGYFRYAVYAISFKEILWYLYRGQANTIIIYIISILPAIIISSYLIIFTKFICQKYSIRK